MGDAGVPENAIFDASWVRLRELSLSYRLDLSKKIEKVLHAMEFSFTGRNLWISTDYPGVDPETSLLGAGSNVGGFDYFNMPSTKSYLFGIKAFFN